MPRLTMLSDYAGTTSTSFGSILTSTSVAEAQGTCRTAPSSIDTSAQVILSSTKEHHLG